MSLLPSRLTCPAVDNLAIAIQGSGLTRRRGRRFKARHGNRFLADWSDLAFSRFSRLHRGRPGYDEAARQQRMMPRAVNGRFLSGHWSLPVTPTVRPWRPAELAASTRIFVGQRLVDDLWEAARAWDAGEHRTCASELRALLTRAGVKPSHRLPMPVQG